MSHNTQVTAEDIAWLGWVDTAAAHATDVKLTIGTVEAGRISRILAALTAPAPPSPNLESTGSSLGVAATPAGRRTPTGGEVKAKIPLPDLGAGMNKLERDYAFMLEARRRAGEIVQWRYERITLKLGVDLRYTPDFSILENDGSVTFVECKGHMRDDAQVKLRAAATEFPEYTFLLWQHGEHKTVQRIP